MQRADTADHAVGVIVADARDSQPYKVHVNGCTSDWLREGQVRAAPPIASSDAAVGRQVRVLGQRVTKPAVRARTGLTWTDAMKAKCGARGRIVRCTARTLRIKFEDGQKLWFPCACCTADEVPRLTTGDVVLCCSNGAVGVIVTDDHTDTPFEVRFEAVDGTASTAWLTADAVRAAPPIATWDAAEASVGRCVRVLGQRITKPAVRTSTLTWTDAMKARCGARGCIVRRDGSDNTLYVRFEDGQKLWVPYTCCTADVAPTQRLTTGDVVQCCHNGAVGIIVTDDRTNTPYEVQIDDSTSGWLRKRQVRAAPPISAWDATEASVGRYVRVLGQRITRPAVGASTLTWTHEKRAKCGARGCIIQRDGLDNTLYVRFEDGQKLWFPYACCTADVAPHRAAGDVVLRCSSGAVGVIVADDHTDTLCNVRFEAADGTPTTTVRLKPNAVRAASPIASRGAAEASVGRYVRVLGQRVTEPAVRASSRLMWTDAKKAKCGARGRIVRRKRLGSILWVRFEDGHKLWFPYATCTADVAPACRLTTGDVVQCCHNGAVGVIVTDDHSDTPYEVQVDDFTPGWLRERQVRAVPPIASWDAAEASVGRYVRVLGQRVTEPAVRASPRLSWTDAKKAKCGARGYIVQRDGSDNTLHVIFEDDQALWFPYECCSTAAPRTV